MRHVTVMAALAFVAGCGAAEPTDFRVRIENMSREWDFLKSGAFDTPEGSDVAGPLRRGESYEIRFTAPPGSRLSFAMMFGQSNDLFLAPRPEGIELWRQGEPLSGDLTSEVKVWDAGTELNEEPGAGPGQPQRGEEPGLGEEDVDGAVRPFDEEFDLPRIAEYLDVSLESEEDGRFVLRIANISNRDTLQTSRGPVDLDLSRGVWVIHDEPNALFTPGERSGEGLELLAEEGDPEGLRRELDERTGLTVDLSPGIYAVFNEDNPLFREGRSAGTLGLERLAEDGDPTDLDEAIVQRPGVQQSGLFSNNQRTPIGPGEAYEFEITGAGKDRFTFATMFVQSNDLFFGPDNERGIDLFDLMGDPISGDVTDKVTLWDAGTEVNQDLGAGPDQAPFQRDLDLGEEDPNGRVRKISETAYADRVAPIEDLIRVTIVPIGAGAEDEGGLIGGEEPGGEDPGAEGPLGY